MINNKEERDITLKNDIYFKAFFTKKGNEKFLIDFLEALLKVEIKEIKIIGEASLLKLAQAEKGGRLDIQAELNNGTIIDIEMQVRNENNIIERSTYYASRLLSQEMKAGKDFRNLKKVIGINILDYEMLDYEEYISETKIVLDKHREYEIVENLKWYFIELPKFRKAKPDMEEKINQWLAFIDNKDRGLVEMAEKKNETLKEAKVEFYTLTADEELRWIEERIRDREMEHNTELSYAREEGIKKGQEKNKKETAKKMKKEGLSIELIMKITDLSKEEIEKL